MQTLGTVYETILRRMLADRIATLSDELISGGGVDNFPAYRHKAGRIAGMREALDMCAEAATEADKR